MRVVLTSRFTEWHIFADGSIERWEMGDPDGFKPFVGPGSTCEDIIIGERMVGVADDGRMWMSSPVLNWSEVDDEPFVLVDPDEYELVL